MQEEKLSRLAIVSVVFGAFSHDSRRFLPGSRLFRPSGAVIGLLLSLLCLLFLRAAGCGMDGIGGPTSSAVERAQVRGSRSGGLSPVCFKRETREETAGGM